MRFSKKVRRASAGADDNSAALICDRAGCLRDGFAPNIMVRPDQAIVSELISEGPLKKDAQQCGSTMSQTSSRKHWSRRA